MVDLPPETRVVGVGPLPGPAELVDPTPAHGQPLHYHSGNAAKGDSTTEQSSGKGQPAGFKASGHEVAGDSTAEATASPPSEHASDPTALAELAQTEEPYFRPYWTAEFVVTALAAILMIWALAWLYVGAFWSPTSRLGNLHVSILDCDVVPPASALGASFAPLLAQLAPTPLASLLLAGSVWNASSPLGGGRLLHYEAASCEGGSAGQAGGCGPREAECVAALAEDVRQGGPWALLYFPANFTASYLSWYPGSGISPPEQRPTGVYYYARGRDYSTYTYVSSIVLNSLLPGVSRSLTLGLATNTAVMKLLSPSFLAIGVGLREVDMAPVHNFGQHFATYIFCVLLWLGSSFVVGTSYQFKLPTEVALLDPRVDEEQRGVRLGHLAWALWVKGSVAAVFMFVEMILLCVVLWALGKGNEAWYRNAGQTIAFGWYMSWSFISVNAVLLHAMGPDRFSSVSALLLILQLTACSGIMTSDLSNRFFYIGKGMPFYYGVRGFRTLFFGTLTSKMYQNWLVLTAYNVVFAPLGLWLVARRVWKSGQQLGARPGGAAAVGSIMLPVVAGAV